MRSSERISVRLAKRVPGFELDTGWDVSGGLTVLFGYSGAGKSLTMSLLTGAMRPDSGWVRFGGETLVDTRAGVWVPPQGRRFGYVSQSAELFPHMTVRRNIEYALKGAGREDRSDRVNELLDSMRIAELAQKLPHQISGGQRQRAALARALAQRPRALLLDEPFSALDLPVRVEMRALLRDVQREQGIPVVMVTHDLYEACTLADTMVVFSGTGVVQVGSPRELLRDPGTPEIRRLMHAVDVPDPLLIRN
jgi:molybdate transport system ATP-binding protein